MIERKGSVFFYDTSEEKLSNNCRRFRGTVTSLVSSRSNRASRWSSASTYQVFMMQSDLFILIRGWTTSLRILWLLVPRFVHATSIISLSLLPLRARSSFVRDDGQRRARLARSFSFPPRKRPTNRFSCRCLSRCLIRSTSSSADEGRNVGSATYTIEKVSTRKIPRYPLLFQP